MGKPSKLDAHPDRSEIIEMLRAGATHKEITAKINAKYPKGDKLQISTAAISRYINKENLPIELPSSIEKDMIRQQQKEAQKSEYQKKVEYKIEVLEGISMSESLQNNLSSLVQLLPAYISEGRDAKEIKALSEATKVYYELLNTIKKTEDPTSDVEITYDDIMAVEADFEKE